MSEIPTGTVTFLFTDIEGSTKLWQQHPDAMPAALAYHHAILNETIAAHGGYVFQIIGDAFCAAFSTATDGLGGALAAQRGLRDATWGETGAIRVRMALHTGAAEVRAGEFTSGEYVSGLTLSRAARLLSAGHGGQILLSLPTAELVRDHLPKDVAMRDLGARRLKDLIRPEQICQVCAPDLPTDFAPLKTLDVHPHNLPVQLTSFVGRAREMDEVKKLFTGTHLLTLTGAGGTGKTRLALQSAADLIDEFTDGVWLVELAPLTDPARVVQAIASLWDVRELPGRLVLDILTDYVRAKNLLLILDNCEHLIETCAKSAETLLRAAPKLKILATSREALGIAGETTYRVPSLSLPPIQPFDGVYPEERRAQDRLQTSNLQLPTSNVQSLTQYEAVRLFIDRVTSIKPEFQVTNANAPAVAQVCHRLDGIPLAIELAAARIKVLSVEQIAARLDDRFRLLTGGSRTALPRQQTLRALIDWSFDLLSDQERALLRRLSVFAGGFTLEAVEQICAEEQRGRGAGEKHKVSPLLPSPPAPLLNEDVLDLLTRLADKSLIVVEEHEGMARYRMLETIRQYARDKLLVSGETERVRDRHLDFFVKFAEQAEPKLQSAEQKAWLNRLEGEHDNLRAALQWSLENKDAVQVGLRLAAAVWWFWFLRGSFTEGREWLEKAMAMPGAEHPSLMPVRAKALCRAGWLAHYQGDRKRAGELAEIALSLCRQVDDQWNIAFSLELLGAETRARDWEKGQAMLEESLALFRELGPAGTWGYADTLSFVAWGLLARNDLKRATELMEEDLILLRELGDRAGVAHLLADLGVAARLQGDYARADQFLQESVSTAREASARLELARNLAEWGITAREQGRYEQATHRIAESVDLHREIGNKSRLATSLLELGIVAWRQGDGGRAMELLDECIVIRGEIKQPLAYAQLCLGDVFRSQDNLEQARALYTEALSWERDFRKDAEMLAGSLRRFAALAGAQARGERAIRLFGAAEASREANHVFQPPVDRADDEREIAVMRAQLGEARFDAAWAEGQKLTLEQAIDLVLKEVGSE